MGRFGTFEHFNLNEGRLAQVVESGRPRILAQIKECNDKRAARHDLLHRISREEDATSKLWMENDAKQLDRDIQALLREIGHLEHGH